MYGYKSILPLLLMALAGAGCSNRLIFAEKSSVAIAVGLAGTGLEPVSVQIGSKRAVGAVVPPTTTGEAASMISLFKVSLQDENGNINLRNGFAAGAAATTLAESPALMDRLFMTGTPALTAEAVPIKNSLMACAKALILPANATAANALVNDPGYLYRNKTVNGIPTNAAELGGSADNLQSLAALMKKNAPGVAECTAF